MIDKEILLTELKAKVLEKIETLEHLINDTRASNNDTKSSMGDKYETSREVLQQQINNLQNQLKVVQQQLVLLNNLNISPKTLASLGSIVTTNIATYFISISLGELKTGGNKVFAISEQSPIGQFLLNKKIGDEFSFNSKKQSILAIY